MYGIVIILVKLRTIFIQDKVGTVPVNDTNTLECSLSDCDSYWLKDLGGFLANDFFKTGTFEKKKYLTRKFYSLGRTIWHIRRKGL